MGRRKGFLGVNAKEHYSPNLPSNRTLPVTPEWRTALWGEGWTPWQCVSAGTFGFPQTGCLILEWAYVTGRGWAAFPSVKSAVLRESPLPSAAVPTSLIPSYHFSEFYFFSPFAPFPSYVWKKWYGSVPVVSVKHKIIFSFAKMCFFGGLFEGLLGDWSEPHNDFKYPLATMESLWEILGSVSIHVAVWK